MGSSLDDLAALLGTGLTRLERAVARAAAGGPTTDGTESSRRSWGGVAQLVLNPAPPSGFPLLASAQNVWTVDTPAYDEERDFVVQLQALDLPPAWSNAATNYGGYIVAQVQSYSGSANKAIDGGQVILTGYEPVEVPVVGRKISLRLAWLNYNPQADHPLSTPAFLRVVASIATCKSARVPGQRYAGALRWARGAALYSTALAPAEHVANVSGIPVGQVNSTTGLSNGQILAMFGTLMTSSQSGSSPTFVQLYDSPLATAPAGGAIPLWSSGPLIPAQGFSFSDELIPGDMLWTQGLWVGLSSTPEKLATVTGTFSFNCKAG